MTLFLLGLVASVPLAIGANLLTPWVATRLAERNTRWRQARIAKLRKEAELVATYRDGSSNLAVAEFARRLGVCIVNSAIGVVSYLVGAIAGLYRDPHLHLFGLFIAAAGAVAMTVMVSQAFGIAALARKVTGASGYDERTARQLRRLGEPPEPDRDSAAVAGGEVPSI